MIVRSTSRSEDESEDDQTKHNKDFCTREPELELPKEAYTEVVDCNDSGEDDSHVDGSVCSWSVVVGLVEPISNH